MVSLGGEESPPSAVCCMCGDHGLLQELFQCKVCLVRSQHKYCSDLYLKTESYRACNWCLRDDGGAAKPALPRDHHASTKLDHAKKSISHFSNTTIDSSRSSTSSGSGSSGSVKIHREAFPSSQLHKPVKKLRLLDRSASDITDRMRSTEELSPSSGRGKQVAKGKVRRYKLLEEFSS